jgi:hypothetical protein
MGNASPAKAPSRLGRSERRRLLVLKTFDQPENTGRQILNFRLGYLVVGAHGLAFMPEGVGDDGRAQDHRDTA